MNAKMLSEGEIPLRRRAIVTGNFDGCHLGHRALFNTLKERAAEGIRSFSGQLYPSHPSFSLPILPINSHQRSRETRTL